MVPLVLWPSLSLSTLKPLLSFNFLFRVLSINILNQQPFISYTISVQKLGSSPSENRQFCTHIVSRPLFLSSSWFKQPWVREFDFFLQVGFIGPTTFERSWFFSTETFSLTSLMKNFFGFAFDFCAFVLFVLVAFSFSISSLSQPIYALLFHDLFYTGTFSQPYTFGFSHTDRITTTSSCSKTLPDLCLTPVFFTELCFGRFYTVFLLPPACLCTFLQAYRRYLDLFPGGSFVTFGY